MRVSNEIACRIRYLCDCFWLLIIRWGTLNFIKLISLVIITIEYFWQKLSPILTVVILRVDFISHLLQFSLISGMIHKIGLIFDPRM